ncbi:MAG TPA: 2-dehydropantoate 2-reductase [Gemmatimonadaceae bacterium]|nr:2-dehydropantoate 2-reductase [Gemmatimonadaceae bacterium]
MVRIAVFGSGTVGGYFGGRLAAAGEDVSFIARGAHLAAIRERGLRVTSILGDFVVDKSPVTDDPASVGQVDIVILGVKAWDVRDAARTMRPLIGADTAIVPLENGVEAPEQLAEALGRSHVLGGFCRILGWLAGPGHIHHEGVEPYIAFGELDARPSRRTERLLEAFSRARGVRAEVPPDIRVAMWSKFILIEPWSGLGALTRAPVGELRTVPETRRLWEQAMEEVRAVAAAQEVALPRDVIARTFAYIETIPAGGTASMQRDVMEGRPSELDAQVGAVVRLGRRSGIPVPIHEFMYSTLLPLERQARGETAVTIAAR